MRPRSWKGLEFYKKHMVKWKGTQEHHHITLDSAPLTRSVSCSVVCPYVWPAWSSDPGRGMPWSQSSCGVLTAWGCWESGGGQPALEWKKESKRKSANSMNYQCSYPGGESLISSCATFSNTDLYVCKGGWWLWVSVLFFCFHSKWKTKVSQGGGKIKQKTEQCFALPPRRGGLISLCWVKELWGSLPSCQRCCSGRSKSLVTSQGHCHYRDVWGAAAPTQARQHHLPQPSITVTLHLWRGQGGELIKVSALSTFKSEGLKI